MNTQKNSAPPLTRKVRIMAWTAQLIAAAILDQTLFFKFSAAPEAVHLFEQMGAEPWGRIGTGIIELVAVVLLLTPRLAAFGGMLAVGLMVGAIGSHLTRLGIEVGGDGGTLFAMAWAVLISGLAVVYLRRADLPLPSQGKTEATVQGLEAS